MLRFTCYFHVSDNERICVKTPENAKHVLSCELLDDDSSFERVRKLDAFSHKCDELLKALCDVYSFVTLTKVRTQIKFYENNLCISTN